MTLPWMAAKIVLRLVAELRPHAGNARVHSAEQLEQIKASMLAFGFTNPLLVDEDGVLIAGHGRLEAASALGIAKVPVIVLRHLSPAQKEALRLADNRIAENATWDQALLRDALAAVQAVPEINLAALGFSAAELADILAAAGEAVSDGDAPEALSADPAEGGGAAGAAETEERADDPADANPESPRHAVTRPGDLWLLGEHRLLCGDSTDAASMARVMDEDRAALLFTSPPYGNQRDYTTGGGTDWDALMHGVFQHLDAAMRPDGQVLVNLGLIHRDNEWQPYWSGWLDWMADMGFLDPPYNVAYEGGTAAKMTIANDALGGGFLDFLRPALANVLQVTKGACYVCMSSSEWPVLHRAWQEAGGKWSSTIIWAKNTFALGRADYHQQFEAMLYGWKAGSQHYWCGARDQGNVWHFDKPARNDLHPTMKPVALVERAIRNSSKPRDTVLDCFGGSGTTMIAAERTGRRAVLLEIDPAYADVIVRRWQEATGEAAVLEGEDRIFADVASLRSKDEATASYPA